MPEELFKVESQLDGLSDAEKLAMLVKAGSDMRSAQKAYFITSPSAVRQEHLKKSKAIEKHFDNLLKQLRR